MSGDNLTNMISKEQGIEIFDSNDRPKRYSRPTRTYHEAARDIPVFA